MLRIRWNIKKRPSKEQEKAERLRKQLLKSEIRNSQKFKHELF